MQLTDIEGLLARTPIALQAHPTLLAYLPPDVEVLPDAKSLLARLDSPSPCHPSPMLTFDTDPRVRSRLPLVSCATDPYTDALNKVFAKRYDTVAAYTLKQSQIADRMLQGNDSYEIIVLLLVDGLAYHDTRDWSAQLAPSAQVQPCLAEGPTITRLCFPTIIGTPSIAARLFDAGFTARVGFSYWHREDNELTNRLFTTIQDVRRCGNMKDVVTQLGVYIHNHHAERIYAQIVRVGLDASAHHMRELPPVAALLSQLLLAVQALMKLLAQTGRRAALYLTSDHGILWREEFAPEIIGNAVGSARYAHWQDLGHQKQTGLQFAVGSESYYVLPYPLVRRPLRSDEAGVHGGVSFQESIVPFLSVEVNIC